jgi:hypothetical protein
VAILGGERNHRIGQDHEVRAATDFIDVIDGVVGSLEQRRADFGLERFYPMGDVRLDGVELVGGAGDAAGARDR